MRHVRRHGAVAAALAGILLWTSGGVPASAAPTETQRRALELGLQTVPKQSAAGARSALSSARGVNPMIGLVEDPSTVDIAYWKSVLKAKSAERAKAVKARRAADRRALGAAAVEPLLVDEAEPDAVRGGNDTTANAQFIPAFGTGPGRRPAARILGTLAAPPEAPELPPSTEDDGAIPLAADAITGTRRAASTTGTVGDGPHGTAGDGSGDFDFYAVRAAVEGERLVVDIDTPTGTLDSILVLWDAAGTPVAVNDDADGLDSLLSVTIPASGDYFVSVLGFGPDPLPADPFDSASGSGAGSEGPYAVSFGLGTSDVDVYAVDLRAGDVLSGSVTGAATLLSVRDPAGREVFGSGQDASSIYPGSTPLAGGGNAVVDHVAARAGRHFVSVTGGSGNYDVTLEGYRPGPQAAGVTQKIFLDFDGARLNTGIFGGPGVRTLSPLSAFLGRWGIASSQQRALENRIIATVTENLRRDFAGTDVRVQILNSRDDADTFGRPDVSRLIVGGTIDESGIPTIGIAQSIDPGNFETEETALILLDVVSDPASSGPASFNSYITPASDKVRFVGTALGNIASHEAGHYLGNWHVDQFNTTLNLMDQGGNFPLLYGVGPDNVGGTADDPDVDFGEDVLNPNEGFTGVENTRARTRWALTR